MIQASLYSCVLLGASALAAFGQASVASVSGSAKIVDSKFCLGSPMGEHLTSRALAPDAISLDLGLRVSYQNLSARPVILLLVSNWLVVLSNSREDIARHRNQLVIPFEEATEAPGWGAGDLEVLDAARPEPNLFRIIPPGGVTNPNGLVRIRFQVHKPSADGTGVELLGRKVFFQLDLDHALIADNVARALQARWQAHGTLWQADLRTQPFELAIPRSPFASPCQSNERID
jgi:hypothetical protein